MKFLALILLFATGLSAATISYNKTTGEVVAYTVGGTTGYEGNADYETIQGELTDPANLAHNRVNLATKKPESKTASEITAVKNNKRKDEIRSKVRVLKASIQAALLERQEGFDVSQETTTIRAKIETLKAEYNSLP